MHIVPPQVRRFAGRLSAFTASVDLSLTEDQIFDITGHLWSDAFLDTIDRVAPDWHCVLWNRDAATTGEIYTLGESEAAALAIVQECAALESHDIDPIERTDDELTVWAEGDEPYARIKRVKFVEPDPRTRQRLATLVTPLRTMDDQGLLDALATLPAWRVERDNSSCAYFDDLIPLEKPRQGEWLPPLSCDLHDLTQDERRALLTQNLLPMWVTPNSLVKLLQHLLAEHAPAQRPTLAQCQEGLASALGLPSWQVLVARFRACATPQIAVQRVNDDSVPQIRMWRGQVEMLASVYDYAVRRKLAGAAPVYVQARWLLEYRMSLTYRLVSRADLLNEVRATAGVHPKEFAEFSPEQRRAEAHWDAIEEACLVKAEEWEDAGYPDDVLCPHPDAVRAAQAALADLAESRR